MQLWQDGLVAMLAAIGLASLMWSVVKLTLYGRPEEKRRSVVALIPAQGDGALLEEQVHTLKRLREEQGVFGIILLVDCGLSGEGRKAAELLSRGDRWIALCRPEDVGGYLSA